MSRVLKFDQQHLSQRMMGLLTELSPLQRLVNSPDLDLAFDVLSRELPRIQIHTYPARMEIESWVVPEQWVVKFGTMTDSSGRVIASTNESPLFVVPYSQPVDGWFNKDQINDHLSTRPDRPDSYALEHRLAYNYKLRNTTWGISLPYNIWEQLPDELYHVQIDAVLTQGEMKVAEYTLPGKRSDTITINAHIDELCNDDLSGCVVAMELMRWLETIDKPNYSYQLLLSPELIGTVAYISQNPDVVKRTVALINLETLGAGQELCFKRSLVPGTRIERVARLALQKSQLDFREIGFFEGYGNDERVYSWPGINVPCVALQRYPFLEYHTSDDTPAVVSPQYLVEAFDVLQRAICILERDYVPKYTSKVPIWLSRYNLYFDATTDRSTHHKLNEALLFSVDGERSSLDLAEITDLDFDEVCNYLDKFLEQGLITANPINWECHDTRYTRILRSTEGT